MQEVAVLGGGAVSYERGTPVQRLERHCRKLLLIPAMQKLAARALERGVDPRETLLLVAVRKPALGYRL